MSVVILLLLSFLIKNKKRFEFQCNRDMLFLDKAWMVVNITSISHYQFFSRRREELTRIITGKRGLKRNCGVALARGSCITM